VEEKGLLVSYDQGRRVNSGGRGGNRLGRERAVEVGQKKKANATLAGLPITMYLNHF